MSEYITFNFFTQVEQFFHGLRFIICVLSDAGVVISQCVDHLLIAFTADLTRYIRRIQ
ncbi:Uncharacterised protein [Vibrio cholerae]|nr:Uncharacterised protein [Vibrio cholerae]CSI25663.1 Uncharacterised protein [Vibrio cholerae]CSI38994.1 Uncharacterised protein [Vibrio cholerae]